MDYATVMQDIVERIVQLQHHVQIIAQLTVFAAMVCAFVTLAMKGLIALELPFALEVALAMELVTWASVHVKLVTWVRIVQAP